MPVLSMPIEVLGTLPSMLSAIGIAVPRIMVVLLLVPMFIFRDLQPVLRTAISLAVALPVAAGVFFEHQMMAPGPWIVTGLILKEIAIGAVLGTLLALPFWLYQSIGAIFDMQRGGLIGQQLNPQLGPQEAPTAKLLEQALIVLMIQIGAFVWFFMVLLESYILWPATHWLPEIQAQGHEPLIHAFSGMTQAMALYALPLMGTMLLIEVCFMIMSLYSPQLQVYFLAMPMKTLTGLFVLLVYAGTLWSLGSDEFAGYRDLLDRLPSIFARPPS